MRFSPGCSCCAPPPCTPCTTKNPSKIRITIAGAANGSCSSCADYNTSILLDYSGICFWSYSFAEGPCGVSDLWQFELVTIDDELYAQVSLYRGATVAAVWRVSVQSYVPLNCCEELDGRVLANISDDDSYCDWTGSTITVEAICGETNPSYCEGCLNHTYPDEVEVTITGMVDGSCDCSVINNTFALPINSKSISPCVWQISGSIGGAWCVTQFTVQFYVAYNSLTDKTTLHGSISFGRWDEGLGYTRLWNCGDFESVIDGRVDCMALDTYLPIVSSTCYSNRTECNASGVTFHVRSA